MNPAKKHHRVLCVASGLAGLHALQEAIQRRGYEVLLAFTADHAVAVCVGHLCDAVILDAELVRSEAATLAETLKLARPNVPILFLDHRRDPARKDQLPKGVDAAVTGRSPSAVLAGLQALLDER